MTRFSPGLPRLETGLVRDRAEPTHVVWRHWHGWWLAGSGQGECSNPGLGKFTEPESWAPAHTDDHSKIRDLNSTWDRGEARRDSCLIHCTAAALESELINWSAPARIISFIKRIKNNLTFSLIHLESNWKPKRDDLRRLSPAQRSLWTRQ